MQLRMVTLAIALLGCGSVSNEAQDSAADVMRKPADRVQVDASVEQEIDAPGETFDAKPDTSPDLPPDAICYRDDAGAPCLGNICCTVMDGGMGVCGLSCSGSTCFLFPHMSCSAIGQKCVEGGCK